MVSLDFCEFANEIGCSPCLIFFRFCLPLISTPFIGPLILAAMGHNSHISPLLFSPLFTDKYLHTITKSRSLLFCSPSIFSIHFLQFSSKIKLYFSPFMEFINFMVLWSFQNFAGLLGLNEIDCNVNPWLCSCAFFKSCFHQCFFMIDWSACQLHSFNSFLCVGVQSRSTFCFLPWSYKKLFRSALCFGFKSVLIWLISNSRSRTQLDDPKKKSILFKTSYPPWRF